ncbi:MAG: hypothetical protein AB1921_10475, partial [Thermodesulfobacteriota bacterium]
GGGGKTPFEKSCLSSPRGGCAARGPLFPLPRTPSPFSEKLFETGLKAATLGLRPITAAENFFHSKKKMHLKWNIPHRETILR